MLNFIMAVVSGIIAIILYFLFDKLTRKTKQEPVKESTDARLPEVGDHYLILDHVWRVRSREVIPLGRDKPLLIYRIYAEVVGSQHPYEGLCHKGFLIEELGNFTFLGNPDKGTEAFKKMTVKMAGLGLSIQEMTNALSKSMGDGQPPMSFKKKMSFENLPGLTEEGKKRLRESRGLSTTDSEKENDSDQ